MSLAQPQSAVFPLQFGFAVVVTLAVSPHALFYDAPLLALPVLALVDHWRAATQVRGAVFTGRRKLLLAGLFLAGFGWRLWPLTYVQPLAVLPVMVGAVVYRTLVRSPRSDVLRPSAEHPVWPSFDASVAA